MIELSSDDGKYITQSYPTYFHLFYSKILVKNTEDYKEVTESERTLIEKNDSLFVSPPLSFIDLWNEACGKHGLYNSKTGYFEISVLKDITYGLAVTCYDLSYNRPLIRNIYEAFLARALLPSSMPYGVAMNGLFTRSSKIELIATDRVSSLSSGTSMVNLFSGCTNLKRIECTTYIGRGTNTNGIFANCVNLEYVNFGYIRCNISFQDCPKLNLETMHKMIRSPEVAITITVHPDVYAKLTDEENTEWHAVLEEAVSKNITFVTI